jgi:2'-5' RNA ligase
LPGTERRPYALVCLCVPALVAERIAVEGGEPADELHVTLAFLPEVYGEQDQDTRLRRSLTLALALAEGVRGFGPLKGRLGGLGQFPDSGKGVPFWVPVDVPGLVELRQSVVATLEATGFTVSHEYGFVPHVTLSFGRPVEPVEPVEVEFDQVWMVADGLWVPTDLKG